jgi:predicted N-acyltransferase
MEPTTEILGRIIAVNPTPDNIRDRLVWAFFNAGAIGANRSARGYEALAQLSRELNIPSNELRWHLAWLDAEIQTEIREMEAD